MKKSLLILMCYGVALPLVFSSSEQERWIMKYSVRWLYLAVLVTGGVLCAPDNLLSRETLRIFEEQLRTEIDTPADTGEQREIDFGGWFNFDLFNYSDTGRSRDRTLRRYQLRGWLKFNIDNVHTGYFRGLLTLDNWAGGDNPIADRGDDFDKRIERAWYSFDLGKFMESSSGTSNLGMVFKVGRDFVSFGSGLVLSTDMDHIRFDATAGNFRFTGLLGMSVRDSLNVDRSPQMYNRSERCFYGFEIGYDNNGNHRPYVYYVSSSDHTTPSRRFRGQRFDYSPRYLGIGSEGVLLPNLAYRAEIAGQWGRAFSELRRFSLAGRDEICAMAANFQLEYLFGGPMRPRLSFEYMYASGDSDRRTSSSATIGGNTPGTKDRAFNAFGFRDTGVAFAPLLSNINIYSLGFSAFPLEHIALFQKMEVGSKLFFYHKDKAGGPVSDFTASNGSKWLGWELDFFCNWRLTSDLAVTARYGLYRPGAAIADIYDETRHFFYTGLIFSF